MVAPIFATLVAGATALALARAQRLAPWFLLVGALLLGRLWLLGRLRVPWPDPGPWAGSVLNPHLLATLALALATAGAVGTAVRLPRGFRRSP